MDQAKLDKVYAEYGKLNIQAEVLQGRLMECKKIIAQHLSKGPVVEKPEQVKPVIEKKEK